MTKPFTEHDAVRIARTARDKITGEPMEDGEFLLVCPILTAGALANPNYERAGVACLEGQCEFYHAVTLSNRACAIYRLADCVNQLYSFADRYTTRKR